MQLADADFEVMEDGRRRRRRRVGAGVEGHEKNTLGETSIQEQQKGEEEDEGLKRKNPHECPVPKPGGIIGEVLGFKHQVGEKVPRPRVETVKTTEAFKGDVQGSHER